LERWCSRSSSLERASDRERRLGIEECGLSSPIRNVRLRFFVVRATVANTEAIVGGLIYLIGLIVVILFILSFLGLR
jgi:hypothetical protein